MLTIWVYILGVKLGGRGGLKPGRNKAEKLAGIFAEEFTEKFAGNLSKIRQTKI